MCVTPVVLLIKVIDNEPNEVGRKNGEKNGTNWQSHTHPTPSIYKIYSGHWGQVLNLVPVGGRRYIWLYRYTRIQIQLYHSAY
eukprot:SAG31_NODE_2251_length_6082_cov_2.050643_8_plen_83_part_00